MSQKRPCFGRRSAGSLQLDEAVQLFCHGRASRSTTRSYRAALAPFLQLCSEQGVRLACEVTPGVVARLPAALTRLAPSTRRHRVSVVRAFLHYAERAGWCPAGAAGVLRPDRRVRRTGTAPWTLGECRRLIAKEPSWRGRALLWVLVSTGCRIGEAVATQIRDFDGEVLTITGKTGTRAVPLCPEARGALRWYLRHRRPLDPDAPIFVGRQGRLTERQARNLVYAACRRAGLSRRGPHAIRHAAAARWLRAGIPLAVVSASLGHARVSTTLDEYGSALAADLVRGLSADPLWDEPRELDLRRGEMGEEAA